MTPRWHALVEQGKVIVTDREQFSEYLRGLEGALELTVQPWRKRRTDKQNAWYWSCVVGIPAKDFGYTPQEMHEAYKWMFLRKEEQGKPATVGSTAKTNTKEFMDYCEMCIRFCAEHGLVIPNPDQVVC